MLNNTLRFDVPPWWPLGAVVGALLNRAPMGAKRSMRHQDLAWLGIARTHIPGKAALAQRLITEVKQTVDVAFTEAWEFDFQPIPIFSVTCTLGVTQVA